MSMPSYGSPVTGGRLDGAEAALLGVLPLLPAGTGSAPALMAKDATVAAVTEAGATLPASTTKVCRQEAHDMMCFVRHVS